jgi:hypothetical protein
MKIERNVSEPNPGHRSKYDEVLRAIDDMSEGETIAIQDDPLSLRPMRYSINQYFRRCNLIGYTKLVTKGTPTLYVHIHSRDK